MKLSARNVLKGKVKQVNVGAVNCEVIIELTGGATIVAVITKASVESLGLQPGKGVLLPTKFSAEIVHTLQHRVPRL